MGAARSDDWLPCRPRQLCLHVDGVVVAAVLSVVGHKGSHFDVGERLTTYKKKTAVLYTFKCHR